MNVIDPKTLVAGTLFAAALAFSSCGSDDDTLDYPVRFTAANLKSKICEALGKPDGAFLTGKDLALLENLKAEKGEITNLSGLEHATKLTKLHLPGNKITSVFTLATLTNLTNLNLSANHIGSVSPLAKLTDLNLSENRIIDVASLAKLTKLTKLILVDAGNVVDARRDMLEKALPNCDIQFD
ncbi:MAG: leucine-rich repeat domain-containing protein [Opitutales bacterium]